jgi:PadR family transcriptional regulator PadR
VKQLTEAFRKELVQRIVRNLLDVQILRLIRTEPMWGYRIKKQAEAKFGVKLRHGALYPMLNKMERESFVIGQNQIKGGRTRKVYQITGKGEEYLKTYNKILEEQMQKQEIEQRNQDEK